jgi:hypothetical protein
MAISPSQKSRDAGYFERRFPRPSRRENEAPTGRVLPARELREDPQTHPGEVAPYMMGFIRWAMDLPADFPFTEEERIAQERVRRGRPNFRKRLHAS